MTTELRRKLAVGAVAFAATAPATYMLHRVYERLRAGTVDPSLILLSTHVDFLWRVAVATWVGGLAALAATHRLTDPARRARSLAGIAAALAALVALVAWRLP
jgi:hypothetical protein